jgi:predicted  nucleic acid-binding Zn-ribbon protein
MKKVLYITFISFALTSCSKKVFDPIYTTTPTLESVPKVAHLAEREIPPRERKELNINLFKAKSPLKDEYFNNPGAKKNSMGKAPSVIIAVPKQIAVSGKKSKEFEETDDHNKIFRTDGYYNEAEQAIERGLLSIGFNVLDRSKFEAKLRDLRDRANDKPWFWNDWTKKLLKSGEYDVVKNEYKKQFQEGTITAQQYTEVINEIDRQSQRGLPGKNRKEDEMNDIAEVIRAAQTGADQSDYLLQINEVSFSNAGDQKINLKEIPEVKDFIMENDGLVLGSGPHKLPVYIQSKWLRTGFNAKLIEIRTGSIVWIGSHELESMNTEHLKISFDIQKYVNNADEINDRIERYNSIINTQQADLENIKVKLRTAYATASRKKKFGNADEMNKFKNKLVLKIKNLESKYTKGIKLLNETIKNPPKIAKNPWTYQYDIAEPIYIPNLFDKNVGEQDIIRHKRKLIKQVTKDLIKTIVIQ